MGKNTDARKSWFARHKILTGLLVLVLLGIIVSATGGSKSAKTTASQNSGSSAATTQPTTAKQYRFADRADKQVKDIEVLPNEAATLSGVKMTVTSVEYKTSIDEYEKADAGKTYLVATVSLDNTSDRTQSYNSLDFRVQTAGGQVLDSTYVSVPSPLNSADLVAGGKATGSIAFEVPTEQGHQYMIWKPSFASERAIVQVQ